jgi:hypothetical protein
MVHAFQLLFIDCNYPRAFVWFIGMHAVMFFFLFNEFYKQAYQKKVKLSVTKNAVGKVCLEVQQNKLHSVFIYVGIELASPVTGRGGLYCSEMLMIPHCIDQAWATFPSLGAKLSFCLRVKGRTRLLNKIN